MADYAAFGGLLLGALSLAWHVWTHVSSRGYCKIDWSISYREKQNEHGLWLAAGIVLANSGRRSIFVANACYAKPNEDFDYFQFTDEISGELVPGDWRQVSVPAQNFLRPNVVGFYVVDGLGGKHWMPELKFKAMIRALDLEAKRLRQLPGDSNVVDVPDVK